MHRPLAAALALAGTAAAADPARIVAAEARAEARGWTVSVTLRHGDTGWDDYADGWRILDGDGRVIGTRELLHPHVTEQPFTRSLRVEALPDGALFVESSTSVTGWSGDRAPLDRGE
jgi:hypothetical protein